MTAAFSTAPRLRPVRRLTAMLLAALTVAAGVTLAAAAPSQAVTSYDRIGDFVFTRDDAGPRTTSIYAFSSHCTSTDLTLPPEVTLSDEQRYTLVGILGSAFYQKACDLTSLSLPSTLTAIGRYAFAKNNLTTLTIPNSVTSIGDTAFFNNRLTSVTLSNSLTNIEYGTFDSNQLTSVTIPDSVTNISTYAFSNNRLTSVTLPNSLKSIAQQAFQNNPLKSITIPASVTSIEYMAFMDNQLSDVYFEGPPPATFRNGAVQGSLGSPNGLVIHYSPQYDASRIPGGFTCGSWQGYASTTDFTVSFDSNGGSPVTPGAEDVACGTSLGSLPTPTRSGYRFDGWFAPGATTAFDAGTAVNGDLALTAHWVRQRSVTFNSNGGEEMNPATAVVDDGSKATQPATNPTRTGYAFTGWYTDRAATHPFAFATTPVNDDIALYAGWSINSYTVTFDSGGGSAITSKTTDYDTEIAAPADPTRTGYTFTGWYTDQAASHPFAFATTPIAGDLTLHAGWRINTYTVDFDVNGGSTSIPSESVDHGDAVAMPLTPPHRTGYTFVGWFTDTDATNDFPFDTPITGDMTAYAGWSINQYTVTFDSDHGSPVDPIAWVEYNTKVGPPADPTRAGYRFDGWFAPGETEAFDFATAPITDYLTLTAKWVPVVTLTFDSNGGDSIATVTVDEGSTPPAPPEPSRTGYTFAGWFTDPGLTAPFDPAAPVTASVTLYAKWQVDSYTVAFDSTGGSAVAQKAVDYGSKVAAPTDPTRTGYAFTGWYTDRAASEAFDFGTAITGDLTLYAGWKTAPPKATPPMHEPGHGKKGQGTDENGSLSDTGSGTSPAPPLIGALLLIGGAGALMAARRRLAKPARRR